jgi:hypothetical protein
MTTTAPPLTRSPGSRRMSAHTPSRAVPTARQAKPTARIILITANGSSQQLTTSLPTSSALEPAAVIVVAADGDLHPELWPHPAVPVLVVLPPQASAAAVLDAFRAGADACVATASTAEVTAHLGALLRRNALHLSQA